MIFTRLGDKEQAFLFIGENSGSYSLFPKKLKERE